MKQVDSIIITNIVRDTIIMPGTKDTVWMRDTTGMALMEVPGKPTYYFYTLPVGPQITYRVQIGTSKTPIPPAQYKFRYKGLPDVSQYLDEDGLYKYTSGDFTTAEEAKKYKETLRTKGYKDAFIVPFHKNVRLRYK